MQPVPNADIAAALFPPGVMAFEVCGAHGPWDLTSEEREFLAGAVPGRVNEFGAGRACARAGLASLGWDGVSIPADPDRAPIWPHGAIGSITHVDDYCLAVVARLDRIASLGVDAERVGRVTPNLWPMVMNDLEIDWLARCEQNADLMATVVFSAKEAFYKCQYPMTREWLGFKDVSVKVEGDVFEIGVLKRTAAISRSAATFTGRLLVRDQLVICGIAMPARGG
jgi:4'-phosphopantetheinyl transferase EntD